MPDPNHCPTNNAQQVFRLICNRNCLINNYYSKPINKILNHHHHHQSNYLFNKQEEEKKKRRGISKRLIINIFASNE